MNWKTILTFFPFFVATPLLLGQVPGESLIPPSSSTSTPAQLIVPSTSPALDASSLDASGLNTESMDQSWGERAEQNQSDYQQGLPQEVPSSEIPSPDSEGMAKDFAQELFPQEYGASQGQLNNIPQSTSSPSIPSSPSFPSSPSPAVPAQDLATVPAQDLAQPTPTPTAPSF